MQKNNIKPKLIITCGLMGSGKSTVAKEIGKKKNITILTSDVIRKEIAGISSSEHRYEDFDQGIYSKEFSTKTYLELNVRAKKILLEGKSVILDACYGKKWQWQKAYETAKESEADFCCIECVCPDEEIKKRLTQRFDSKDGASDGRWEIFPAQKASFEKIDEFSENEHLIIDTSNPVEKCIEIIIKKFNGD